MKKKKKNTKKKNQKDPKARKRNVKIGRDGKIRVLETDVDGVTMIMIMIHGNHFRSF